MWRVGSQSFKTHLQFFFCHAYVSMVLECKGLRLSRSKTEYMECKFNANGGSNELGVRIGDHKVFAT